MIKPNSLFYFSINYSINLIPKVIVSKAPKYEKEYAVAFILSLLFLIRTLSAGVLVIPSAIIHILALKFSFKKYGQQYFRK